VSLSDEALRRALLDRAGTVDSGTLDLSRVAEAIAAQGQVRRAPWTGWLGLAAALIVVAVGGAGLLVRLRTPGESPPASASVMTSFARPSPSTSPSPTIAPSPSVMITGCDAMGFAPSRCDWVVAAARARAGNQIDVVRAVVRRDPEPDVSLGTFSIAVVDLISSDGVKTSIDIRCGLPGPSDRLCNRDAKIFVAGGVDYDVPCGPEPGDENHPCATLPPTPRPASVAKSTPLRLPALDIPLDHLGQYEVLAGIAWLPDGALTERSATLADPRPTTFWIDDGVLIDVRPDGCRGTCPSITSVYREPYPGPRPVHVYLVFEVAELNAPGAVLQVRDLVVR
jgi:hypothetical protein